MHQTFKVVSGGGAGAACVRAVRCASILQILNRILSCGRRTQIRQTFFSTPIIIILSCTTNEETVV